MVKLLSPFLGHVSSGHVSLFCCILFSLPIIVLYSVVLLNWNSALYSKSYWKAFSTWQYYRIRWVLRLGCDSAPCASYSLAHWNSKWNWAMGIFSLGSKDCPSPMSRERLNKWFSSQLIIHVGWFCVNWLQALWAVACNLCVVSLYCLVEYLLTLRMNCDNCQVTKYVGSNYTDLVVTNY